MSPAQPPSRAGYRQWRSATTRWADDDVYGHMNNAVYLQLIDTAVNAYLIEATGVDIRALSAIGVVAEVSCRYYSPLRFPAPVELGLVVDRIGGSSVVYRVGLFRPASEAASAEGRFVHVYVDNGVTAGERPVVPVPDEIRAVTEPLLASSV